MTETLQMRQAKVFTKRAIRAGFRAKLKMPDGEEGSIYVRLQAGKIFRFADHSQKQESDENDNLVDVGGYSETLGRRHHAATFSVNPKRFAIGDPEYSHTRYVIAKAMLAEMTV